MAAQWPRQTTKIDAGSKRSFGRDEGVGETWPLNGYGTQRLCTRVLHVGYVVERTVQESYVQVSTVRWECSADLIVRHE